MDLRALIIGGDKRQEYLKKSLENKFDEVFHIKYPADIWMLDEIETFSHIILPIPFSKDKENIYSSNDLCLKTDDIFELIKPCHKVFGTGFDSRTIDFFEDKQIDYCDFMKDKIFKRANALLTAQGVLRLILDNTEDCIVGKKVLIIGLGDVADTLSEKLKNNGFEVYMTGRNKQKLVLSSLGGFKTVALSSISSCIYLFDYVFGTVPANILSSVDVKNLKNECTYIELASPPFTAEEKLFREHQKKYINGSSLPGRFLPLASAKLIADYVLNNL